MFHLLKISPKKVILQALQLCFWHNVLQNIKKIKINFVFFIIVWINQNLFDKLTQAPAVIWDFMFKSDTRIAFRKIPQ